VRAVLRLIGGGVVAAVLGVLLYQFPDMEWYMPLPAFLVSPLLIALGIVHWRNLRANGRWDEMPDEPGDDALIDELLASNTKFQALVAKSRAGPRNPFPSGDDA
jgi:hypothetical protein